MRIPERPRRLAFSKLMQESNIRVRNVKNTPFENLKALYDTTAIMLNIRQNEHLQTLEEFRVLPALLRGVIIISEDVPLKENISYHEFMLWTSWQSFPETTRHTMENYDEVHDRYSCIPLLHVLLTICLASAKHLQNIEKNCILRFTFYVLCFLKIPRLFGNVSKFRRMMAEIRCMSRRNLESRILSQFKKMTEGP